MSIDCPIRWCKHTGKDDADLRKHVEEVHPGYAKSLRRTKK